MENWQTAFGLQDIQLISENERNAYYSAMFDGERVFVKRIKDPVRFLRESGCAYGFKALFELDPMETFYRVPKILLINPPIIVTSWADGKMMKDRFIADPASALQQFGEQLFGIYQFIDSRALGNHGVTRYNLPGDTEGGLEAMLTRLRATNYKSQLRSDQVDALTDFLRSALSQVETRFADGDLQPSNILCEPSQKVWTIVDGEACSSLWPRHYSAVNFVFNYSHAFPEIAGELHQMLLGYLRACGSQPGDTSTIQLANTSAALRIIGLIIERSTAEGLPEKTKSFVTEAMANILSGKIFSA